MELYTTPLGRRVIGCAIEVHKALGPGLLESVYERVVAQEFRICGLSFETQAAVPVVYKGMNLDCGYRIDLLVEDEIIIELKSIERLEPVHSAQLLSYLRLSKLRVGLLINFNVKWLTQDGIKRIVNGFPE